MKKIFKTVAALAVVMFAGCTNDLTNEVVAPVGDTTVVGVGFDDTKTYLGELVDGARKVYWSEGDQIAINGNASTSIAISENERYAEFTFNGILNYPYSVLYPAADYVDASTINLPAVQEAAEGTFATNSAPMACVAGEDEALTLHHLASVVRLQVKLPAESEHAAHKLAKVEFCGKAGEQVSGNFAINYAEATLTATSEAEVDKVVTTKVNKALSADATDVFVVVPAGEYAEGFTVRLIDEAGHYMDIATNAITLAKGDIKAMPAFDFVPTGTLVGVQISSAAEWNTFVAAYNNGDYANAEDLKVNITNDLVFDETTSKAFAQIGTFNGTIDGGNFSIKGLKDSNASVINILSEGSTLKNLNIDSSSNFKFTTYWYNDGVFARENKGTIESCNNNANITIVENNRSHEFKIGGLVGTNVGVINNCVNKGNITFTDDVNLQGNKFYLGGIVGFNSGGEINNSINRGDLIPTINNGASQNNFIGGIAGQTSGPIDGCINYGAIKGTLTAKYHYVGGIVGLVTKNTATANVTNNTNNGDMTSYIPTQSGTQRVFIGGIVGLAENLAAKFESNTNNASVSIDKGTNYVYVGGCVGWLPGVITGSFKHNSVTEKVVVTCKSTSSITGVGGLVGCSNGGAVIDLSGDTGVIACTVKGGSSSANDKYVGIGGIVGFLNGTITIKNVTNWTGKLEIDILAKNNSSCAAFGAILGYTTSGVTIDNCTPAGTFEFVNTENVTLNGTLAIGGVLGAGKKGNNSISIINCTNKQQLVWPTSIKSNGSPCYTGGIVGYGIEASTIDNCKHYADITIASTETSTIYYGGIAGYLTNGSTISNSKIGGTVNGETIGNNDYANYITNLNNGVGTPTEATLTLTNNTYWDGN